VSLACRKARELGYPHELCTTRLLACHAREHGPADLGWRGCSCGGPRVSGLPGVFGCPSPLHARPSGAALCRLNATFCLPQCLPHDEIRRHPSPAAFCRAPGKVLDRQVPRLGFHHFGRGAVERDTLLMVEHRPANNARRYPNFQPWADADLEDHMGRLNMKARLPDLSAWPRLGARLKAVTSTSAPRRRAHQGTSAL
jgi:hypothetical protein